MVKTLTRAGLRRLVMNEVRRVRGDFTDDRRFQTAIDKVHELASDYGVPTKAVIESLTAAVAINDIVD